MSRIFDALLLSESQRCGFDLSRAPAVATELLQVAETEKVANARTVAESEPVAGKQEVLDSFPSLQVFSSSTSRFVSLGNQSSLAAEKFRFLAVRLRQLQQTRPLKKLLITSTIPEEGKSTVAGNIAMTLAQRKHQKVLLLEGDLRRPELGPTLGVGRLSGLSEMLRGGISPIRDIFRLEGAGLWFLPAGSPPENTLELMQSGRLGELLDRLVTWFDWIVIDSPPLLPLGDTTVWMRMADAVLMVARVGVTQKRSLKQGIEVLNQSKLVGVVLNNCDSTSHYGYYQRYVAVDARSPTDK